MCGIAGVFGATNRALVDRMLEVMAYRGPDDQFVLAGPDHTLGARRLSIIDLESGRQPFEVSCRPDRPVVVAQNGEIYNFPELREELAARGHRFTSRSDTEVLGHLYEEFGPGLLDRVNGMFAVAVWDGARREGVLLRDPTGKKPVYYWEQGGSLWFASEIKGILQHPDFTREINWEALHHFLSYKHVPAPHSIFAGVKVLPPGHWLRWTPRDGVRITRYWRASFEPLPTDMTEEEIVEELLHHLRRAVTRRLVSDVPIGFFLSGGIDSSLSTAIVARETGQRIKTFTLRYSKESTTEGKELDLQCARQIATLYGTEHHEEEMDPSRFQDLFPEVIKHFDEPFSGVISTYFLSKLIARHVKVALSGDGADELFGSYLSHRLAQPIANVTAARASGLPLDEVDFGTFADQKDQVLALASADQAEWRYKLLVFSDEEKADLYTPEMRDRTSRFPTRRHLAAYFENLRAEDPLNRILEAEFYSFFPDQVLAFVDRLSMAHSLEVRTAYLDKEFVEFASRVPGRLKIKGTETKHILKKAALKYLPEETIFRKKEGFVLPVNDWLATHLQGYLREMLSPDHLAKHGIFDPRAIGGLLSRFIGGEKRLAVKLLTLLAFQVWYEIYFGKESLVCSR